MGFCAVDQLFFVLGGIGKSNENFKDIYVYDLIQKNWIIKKSFPQSMSNFSVTLVGGTAFADFFKDPAHSIVQLKPQHRDSITDCLWVFGGFQDYQISNKLFKIPLDNSMESVEIATQGAKPLPRIQHASCHLAQAELLIIHGGKDRNNNFYKDMYGLDLKSFIWTKVTFSSSSPEYRAGHSVHARDDTILIIGGFDLMGYKKLDIHHV